MPTPLRRQRPVKGGRKPASTGLISPLDRAIAREQQRFGVSRAFVIATAVAFALDVPAQEDYRTSDNPRKLRLVRRAS
jgi:hypothetical protein